MTTPRLRFLLPSQVPSQVSRWLAVLTVSAGLLSACGEPCPRLSAALCDGGDPAYCEQVDAWLASRLIDPETKDPLAGEARDQMCSTIYRSVDVFNAYRFKAKQVILGEPDFTLASATPAANKADPDPPPAKATPTKTPTKAPVARPTPPPPTPPPAVNDDEDDKPGQGGDNMSD